MPLTTCKFCKHSISTSAETCPQCGHNHKKDRQDKANFNSMLWTMAGLILVFIIYKMAWAEPIINTIKNLILTKE